MAADVVANYKLELQRPLITEISDRHGSAKIGETIDSYISDAIGIKL
jgi:V/A-type H+-transporting ATPase subunit F